MRIILDVMGADNSPAELIRGAVAAKIEYENIDITLVGNEKDISDALSSDGENKDDYVIFGCEDFISMEDAPMSVVSSHSDSSMAKALKLLSAGEGDAVISCGNTGALFTGATLIVRRIHGIRRAALGTILPFESSVLLLDCGANVTVTSEYLVQFAYLGSIYMEKVMGVKNPRVGLLNNGTEDHKGTPVLVETHQMLKKAEGINFVGNVEGKDIPFGKCDVLVCDGFSGNVVLKTSEGIAKFAMSKVKTIFSEGVLPKISAFMIKEKLYGIKKFFDATEYGGAPFLGLSKPVIKAHGNSDANAIKNAVRQAANYVGSGAIEKIADSKTKFDEAVKISAESKKDGATE